MMPFQLFHANPVQLHKAFEVSICAICAALPPAFQGEDDVQRTEQLFRTAYLAFFEDVPEAEGYDRYQRRVFDLYGVTDEWLEAAGDALAMAVEDDGLRSWLWVGYAEAYHMLRPHYPRPRPKGFLGKGSDA